MPSSLMRARSRPENQVNNQCLINTTFVHANGIRVMGPENNNLEIDNPSIAIEKYNVTPNASVTDNVIGATGP